MKIVLRKIYDYSKHLIAPELKYSQLFFEEALCKISKKGTRWLDLGCGHHLLPPWRLDEEIELVGRAKNIVGIDYDFPSLTKHRSIDNVVQGIIDELPFPDCYFDLATSNMVVEHLNDPEIQFNEINRVLCPNGIFLFHTVNENSHFGLLRKLISGKIAKRAAAILDERVSEDVFEIHYKANSKKKVEDLAVATGFAVEKIKMVSSSAIFAIIPLLSILELVYLKILMRKSFENFRTNMIVTLRKI